MRFKSSFVHLFIALFRNAVFLVKVILPRLKAWRKKPLVVFDLGSVGLREHFDPVIEWLLTNSGVQILVVVPEYEWNSYQPVSEPRKARYRIGLMTYRDFLIMPFKPAVTVSFHPESGLRLVSRVWRFSPFSPVRIVMQHGLSDKAAFGEIGKSDPLADFDVVFLIGPIFREGSLRKYRKNHPETYSRLVFLNTGSPKTDLLFRASDDGTALLKELGLDTSLRTVCYAPTWERYASLERHGREIITQLAHLDVNVLVKLHHASLDTYPHDYIIKLGHGGRDWRKTLREIEQRLPNVRLAPGKDATPYFLVSDLLVSDVSGAAFEFVLQDKPVIFFDTPEIFEFYGGDGIHYYGRECGDIVTTVEELIPAVQRNLTSPCHMSNQRKKWISRISYSRGDATQRVCVAIVSYAMGQGNKLVGL
ncbi:MAG: CDP-glycerol glycerophosphotransferase family protein [Pseudomonadota bacterium]